MTNVNSIASVAALIGEPTRTAMLMTLMDGRALTAGELGRAAGVSPPTASGHLGRMLDAGLLALERQGRHRYYRLAGAEVAATLERLMSLSGELDLAAARARQIATGPRDPALRRARLCYDHLAGELAVAIADAMSVRGQIDITPEGGILTEPGRAFLASLGLNIADESQGRTRRETFCRPCLDWSERRLHIAGTMGRLLYSTFVHKGWVRPPAAGRAVAITPRGLREFDRHFGLTL